MIFHGVEISIAGGVRKMVPDPTPRGLFFCFFHLTMFITDARRGRR